MHALDLVLYALLLLWPLLRFAGWHRQRPVAMAYAFAVVLWLPLYLALDLARWPVVPAILLLILWEIRAVGVMVGDVPPPPTGLRGRILPFVGAVALVLPAILSPAVLLPRAARVEPTGPYLVGVLDLVLGDGAPTADGVGGIPVRLWYPGEPAPELRRASRHRALGALESDLAERLPGAVAPWMVRGLTRAPMEAYAGLRLSTRQRAYPVVVFSHDAPGSAALHASLLAEMASHGFIVVAIEHLGGSLGSLLPDGRHVALDAGDFGAPGMLTGWASQVAEDVSTTLAGLQQLEPGDSAGRFSGRMQPGAVAWVGVGVSAAAAEAIRGLEAVKAIVVIDPPTDLEAAPPGAALLGVTRADRTLPGALVVQVPAARTADFSDLAQWSPPLLRRAGIAGGGNHAAIRDAIARVVTAFLARHLRGEAVDLESLVGQLPAAQLPLAQPAG